MSSDPIVTVVVPCYQQGHFLGECLRSLQAQSRSDWRAIVVDDCSPDHQLISQVVEALADERVELVRHKRNRGLAAARNTGIRAARTEFVLPVDADDALEPEALACLLGAFEEDPGLEAAYGDAQLFGRSDDVLTFPGPPDGAPLRHVGDTIPGAGTMMRRALWERLGGYDEGDVLRHGREDFEFWMRAFEDGVEVRRVGRPLYRYRLSHTSMSLACRVNDHLVTRYMANKNAHMFDRASARRFVARGYARAALARHEAGERLGSTWLALRSLALAPSWEASRLVARTLLSPSLARRIVGGELRRRLPFVGYPLAGRRRYAPFFIIGAARSGTTLLRRVLTSHSALHVPPETFVLGEVLRGFPRWSRSLDWPELVSLVLSRFEFHPEFETFEIGLGPLTRSLATLPAADRNLAHVLDEFYRFHARETGQTMERWGDKTPLNTLEKGTLEGLIEVFPDARFIHLVRDGCDVVYSHLSGGFMWDLDEAARRWTEMVGRASDFAARHPEQSIEVRYEALVSDPESVARELCEFLEIEFEPQMVASESGVENLGDVPRWYWHDEVARPIHCGNIGKGRRSLSRRQKERLEALIGGELARRGYPAADAVVEPAG